MRKTWIIVGLVLCLAGIGTTLAYDVPPHEGYVTDTAGILSQDEERDLESLLAAYRTETTNEIAVLIVPTLGGEPIADATVEVGRAWGVGTSENDNGIVLLVAVEDRELFIATGYGLEGAVPDIIAKHIIDEEITPSFRNGQYAEGIRRGVDAIMQSARGEYAPDVSSDDQGAEGDWPFPLFVLLIIFFEWIIAILGRTKSWWLGGIFGFVIGIALFFALSHWVFMPLFTLLGLLFDYIISKNYRQPGKTSFWAGGNWGPGGGGGGFSGFSGGSFGGGGAGGRW